MLFCKTTVHTLDLFNCHISNILKAHLHVHTHGDTVPFRLLCAVRTRLERAPTPLFGRLVRCSTRGHSFARLRYMYVLRFPLPPPPPPPPPPRAQVNKTLLILTLVPRVSYIVYMCILEAPLNTSCMCIPLEMFPLVVVLCWVGSFSNSRPG